MSDAREHKMSPFPARRILHVILAVGRAPCSLLNMVGWLNLVVMAAMWLGDRTRPSQRELVASVFAVLIGTIGQRAIDLGRQCLDKNGIVPA